MTYQNCFPQIETLLTEAKNCYKDQNYDKAQEWYGIVLDEAERTTDESTGSIHAFIKSLFMISRCHMEKVSCVQIFPGNNYVYHDVGI
jgi:hypothetical protein